MVQAGMRPVSVASVPSPACQAVNAWAAGLYQAFGAEGALQRLRDRAAAAPHDGNLRAVQGRMLYACGRHEQAVTALAAAAAFGTEIEVFDLLARATFPGPGYHVHLLHLHQMLRPAVYLEIGVLDGNALALAQPGTRAIGIDPRPRAGARRAYAASTQIHRMSSDAYFSGLEPAVVEARRLDLAFVDGLHVFEQVLRDFINVERRCHPGSLLVLHDTLPVAEPPTSRRRQTRYWCGDVWKMLPCLRRYRPDLQLLTIPTYPSGLTLVRGLDPTSRVLSRNFRAAVSAWSNVALPPSAMPPAWRGDVVNDPAAVAAWLRPH